MFHQSLNLKASGKLDESTSLEKMADNSQRGRKRTRNPDIWKRNLAKRKRASGEGYISRAGKPVAEA